MGLIRLLLAMSVIANHCGSFINNDLVGGTVAVQAFYIISGFYMSLVLNEKYIQQNSSYTLFISNRLMKLMPVYWCVLAIVFITSFFITNYFAYDTHYFNYHYYKTEDLDGLSWVFLIFSNIFILGQDAAMYMGIDQSTGAIFLTESFQNVKLPAYHFLLIPQSWSLSIEISFYLIAPLILRKGTKTILLFILLSVCLRLFLYNHLELTNDPWTYRFFPTELLFFLLGYLSYKLYRTIRHCKIGKWAGYMTLIGLVLLTAGYFKMPYAKLSFLPFSFREIFYFAVFSISIPFIFDLTKRYKWDRILGDLSFPVYVIHYFVYCMLMTAFEWGYMDDAFKNSFSVAILSIISAYLLNKFLMEPLEQKRQARLS